MKKKLTSLILVLSILLSLLLSQNVFAATEGAWTYTVTDGNATITYTTAKIGAVVIPSTLGGYPVTAIANNLFSGSSYLTSITIPEGVTSIGTKAFYNCSSLAEVTLPTSLKSIGDSAFDSCIALNSILLPDGITSIGTEAFEYTGLTSITIPSGVTSLNNTFVSCTSLTSVVIPDGMTSIAGAFMYCSGLTSITIPDSVTNLYSAFGWCTGLTSVTIPRNVTNMEATFYGCSNLTSVVMPSSVNDLDGTFSDCSRLTSIIIPSGVTDLFYTFQNCIGLTTIIVPEGVTNIGNAAFSGCVNLNAVTILNPATIIYTASNTIPKASKIIGYAGSTAQSYATSHGNSFEAITQEYTDSGFTYTVTNDKATIISSTATGAVTVPSTLGGYPVTSLGESAFIGCSLTSVTIPESVTSIYDSANTIPAATKIIAPTGSTAQAYASKYGNTFVVYTTTPDPTPTPEPTPTPTPTDTPPPVIPPVPTPTDTPPVIPPVIPPVPTPTPTIPVIPPVIPDPTQGTTQDSALIITGTIQPTIVSFSVPTVINFSINPNGATPAEQFICPDINIKNTCQAPLTVSLKSFVQDATSDYKGFQDVLPTDVTDWNKLNKAETKSKLALGLSIKTPAQWHGIPKMTPTYSKETQSAESILLGTVDPSQTVNLSLTACHGNAFDSAITATYKLVFILDLAD